MTRYLVCIALFLAIMIPFGIFVHWLVYSVLPDRVSTNLGVAIFCLSVGFLLGQRHGIER